MTTRGEAHDELVTAAIEVDRVRMALLEGYGNLVHEHRIIATLDEACGRLQHAWINVKLAESEPPATICSSIYLDEAVEMGEELIILQLTVADVVRIRDLIFRKATPAEDYLAGETIDEIEHQLGQQVEP